MPALRSFAGIRAVITGASSGIGKEFALRLAAEGADVALVARRRAELEQVATAVIAQGRRALVVPADVSHRDQVFTAAENILSQFGGVELLVNNAGYGGHRPFLEWDLDDIERLMQVNYFGSVYWTKALLPHMVTHRRGWIVMMASVAGKLGVPDETAYVATKFAMVGLAEALSYEVEDFGVHVLTVCPGAIDTPFFDERARRRMPEVAKRLMIPPHRVVEATIRGLRSGHYEVTVPPFIRLSYVVRALAPGVLRWNTKRVATPPGS